MRKQGSVFLSIIFLAPSSPIESDRSRVIVSDGERPLSGAHVLITSNSVNAITGLTNADGTFETEVAVDRDRDLAIVVAASGHNLWVERTVVPGSTVHAVLSRAKGAITGAVVDWDTRVPIRNASISARHNVVRSLTKGSNLEKVVDFGELSTTTDSNGRFELKALSSGLYSVQAVADGYHREMAHSVESNGSKKLVFFLYRGPVISGVLSDAKSDPVGGVQVVLGNGSNATERIATTSQKDGSYSLSPLNFGENCLLFLHHDFAPMLLPHIVVEEERERLKANPTMLEGAEVGGHLIGAGGHPISAEILITQIDGVEVPSELQALLTQSVSANGYFRLLHVPPGQHTARVEAKGFLPQELEFSVGSKQREYDLGEIQLESGEAIRGVVTSLDGTPIRNATVRARPYGRSRIGEQHGSPLSGDTVTGPDGTFVLGGLSEGRFLVIAKALGYGSSQLENVRTGETVQINLDRAGGIVGTVLDAEGAPVPAFDLTSRSANSKMASFEYHSISSPTGAFRVGELSSGEYVLHVDAGSHGATSVSGIVVASGIDADVGALKLRPVGTLRGNIIDEASSPVPGVALVVVSQDGRRRNATSSQVGSFEIDGLEPGTAVLTATHPAYTDGRKVVEIGVDSVAEVTMVLEPGATLTGLVSDRNGRGIAGRIVTADRSEFASVGFDPLLEERNFAVTDSEGRFRLDHVASGTVVVRLFNPSLPHIPLQSKEIFVLQDPMEVAFSLSQVRIQGRVARRGAPAANILLSLIPTTEQGHSIRASGPVNAANLFIRGDGSFNALSDESGRFEMTIDQPGAHMVLAEAMDGSFRGDSRWFQIPDEPFHLMDLEYNQMQVSGRVLDERTKRPIVGARILSAVTDLEGRFQFDKEPGEHRAVISADGYVSRTVDFRVEKEAVPELVVQMTPGASIAGRIVAANGSAVANVQIVASPNDRPAIGYKLAFSLEDGTFELPELEDGVYTLFAASQLHGFAVIEGVRQSTSDVILRLDRGVQVELNVMIGDANPLPRADIMLTRIGGSRVPALIRGRTDDNGVLRLNLPPSSLEFLIRAERIPSRTVSLDIPPGTPLVKLIELHE